MKGKNKIYAKQINIFHLESQIGLKRYIVFLPFPLWDLLVMFFLAVIIFVTQTQDNFQ